MGDVGDDFDLLAERLDRLRLIKVDRDDPFRIEESDDAREWATVAAYAEDDFFDAIDDFDRRGLDLWAPEVASSVALMTRMINSVGAHDGEALLDTLADDFQLVDHRPIGFPVVGRDGVFEMTVAVVDEPIARYLSRTVHAMDRRGAVVTGGFWRRHLGDWTEYFASTATVMIEAGKVTLNELFEPDDVDAALGRFAELMGSSDR